MTAARQMAINDSPDKLEINYPGDNPMEVNENFSQQFQSDINVQAIESISTDLTVIKPMPRNRPILNTNRNIIVHALGDKTENASNRPTLKSFLEEISLGNLLTMFQEEDVTIDMIPEMDHEGDWSRNFWAKI